MRVSTLFDGVRFWSQCCAYGWLDLRVEGQAGGVIRLEALTYELAMKPTNEQRRRGSVPSTQEYLPKSMGRGTNRLQERTRRVVGCVVRSAAADRDVTVEIWVAHMGCPSHVAVFEITGCA